MLLPISTDRKLRHAPAVNVALIVVTVLMFLVQRAFPAVEAALLLRPYEPSVTGIVGSAFLHAGWLHLLGNMLFLYIFGNTINDFLGHAGYLALYLGGAVASSLLHATIDDVPALGASGAVAAVTGSYLVLFPRSRVNVLFFYFIITIFSVPALWFVGLFFVRDLIFGIDSSFLGGESRVANWGHIGGGVYGFTVSMLLLQTRLVPRDQFDILTMIQRRRQRRAARAELERLGQSHGSAMDIVPQRDQDRALARVQDLRATINHAFDQGDTSAAASAYAQLLDVDDRQVLSHDHQLAAANQLYRDARHTDAAKAYERYLERYGAADDVDVAQSQLFLGLLMSRYLGRPAEARRYLDAAAKSLDRLGRMDDAAFARQEAANLPL